MNIATDEKSSSLPHWLIKIANSRFIVISALLHFIFALIFGGTVLFQATETPDFASSGEHGFVIDSPDEGPSAPSVAMPKTPDFNAAVISAPSMSMSAITSMAPTATTLNVSAVSNVSSSMTAIAGIQSVGKTMEGTSAPPGSLGHAGNGSGNIGTIFGKKVQASNLGVILDISLTTHLFLPAVIKEIDKQFPHSLTLLVVGCGIAKTSSKESITVEPMSKVVAMKEENLPKTFNVITQLGKSKNQEINQLAARMGKRDNAFTVVGGGYHIAQFAFEKLFQEKVDSIYWFTDFDDKVDETIVADLATKIKSRHIRLYLHAFAGKPPAKSLEELAKVSGGETFLTKPE